ncbi:MAG: acetolactate synthase small subunit [Muribaculaceae bacterium]|nr:acetolactate synthase small subunit [Muribaculaceae bacterium]MDE5845269.1 acetolactate synthase small subunit [Muribaculaceae bacterium]MDE5857751.1 acetolactate synthase small subunit [Muribaculaceae bacterium]
METKLYTITIFSENSVGLLSRVSLIFTRRGINIESISASSCSIPGVTKWIITAFTNRELLDQVAKQVERCIEVLKVFVYDDDEIIYQEVALYKIETNLLFEEPHVERIIREHSARILEIKRDFTVIEKTGHYRETEALFEELKRFNLKQFVRSGRVIVTQSPNEYITDYLVEQNRRINKINDATE